MTSAESEARKALNRFRRAIEKSLHELQAVRGALQHVEEKDFPEASYDEVRSQLADVANFIDAEAERLEEKLLSAGGLEPGRIRRG